MRFVMVLLGITAAFTTAAGQLCVPAWDRTFRGASMYRNNVNSMTLYDPDGPGPEPERIVFGGHQSMRFEGTPDASLVAFDGTSFSDFQPRMASGDVLGLGVIRTPGGPDVLFAQLTSAMFLRLTSGVWTPFAVDPVDSRVFQILHANGRPPSEHLLVLAAPAGAPDRTLYELDGQSTRRLGTLSAGGAVSGWAYWDSDGGGPEPEKLYVVGSFTTIDGQPFAGRAVWEGDAWTDWPGGLVGIPSSVITADIDGVGPGGPRLIAGGDVAAAIAPEARGLVQWDGQSWHPLEIDTGVALGSGLEGLRLSVVDRDGNGPEIPALFVDHPFVDAATGQVLAPVAILDGGNWDYITNRPEGLGLVASTRFGSSGDGTVLWTGTFREGDPSMANAGVAQFDGATWTPLSPFALGYPTSVVGRINTLVRYHPRSVSGGDWVIAGGTFTHSTSGAHWIGTLSADGWSPLGEGVNGEVAGLLVLADDSSPLRPDTVLVGGAFDQAGGQPASHVATWDGAVWSSIGEGLPTVIRSFARYDPDGDGPMSARIYAGGDAAPSSAVADYRGQSLFAWDGTAWSAIPGLTGTIYAMQVFDDDGAGPMPPLLWIGGAGIQSGVGGGSIVRFNGATFTREPPTGSSLRVTASIYTFAVEDMDGAGPDPARLYVGGLEHFILPDGSQSAKIAAWDGTRWSGLGSGLRAPGVWSISGFDPDGTGPHPRQLFACGGFGFDAESNILRGIAEWDGAAWNQVDDGQNFVTGYSAAVADLDGSGTPALYVGGDFYNSFGAGIVRYRCTESPLVCQADTNRDGSVSIQDLFVFLTAYFSETGRSGSTLAADINRDYRVSVEDIFAFLQIWFHGCD